MIRIPALRTFAILASLGAALMAAEPLVKSGESIAFLGDSITQQGAGSPAGYVRLVISGLDSNGIKATAIPAGISGNKSDQMLERLQRDVLDKKPTWLTVSCGVNDVWHGAKGIPLDAYKTNITAIVDRAQAAGVKVVILTATMIKEDPANAENTKLADYNAFLRDLAAQRKLPLADLNAAMQAELKAAGDRPKTGNLLTVDGVHMNPAGNRMMATGVLRAFGLDDAQIAKAADAWTVPLSTRVAIPLAQYRQLEALAAAQKKPVADVVDALLAKAVADAIAAPAK